MRKLRRDCNRKKTVGDNLVQAKLREARVARLATVDTSGHPHVVPVCFVYDGQAFYTPLDLKPKRLAPERLARVRHIQVQPNVALLIDEYHDDWDRLCYILVRGTATLLPPTHQSEHQKACGLLKAKYPQYAVGLLPEDALLIRILSRQIIYWASREE